MKLVIFGLAVSSSWGNGHATLWRGLIRALGRRGHKVVFFEHDVPWYADHRDLVELPGSELRLYNDWWAVRPSAAWHVADADVAMVTSYCPDGIAAAELVAEQARGLRVFYDLDTPVTIAALSRGLPVAYLGPRGLRDFDLVLSYTGGAALEALQTRLGARRVAPLYGSVDPDVHRPRPRAGDFDGDLSYLGTYAADRQEALDRLCLEPARRLPRLRFLLSGAQYPDGLEWPPNVVRTAHLAPAHHADFYASCPLTLNVTRRAMAAGGFCPSGRLFEAAACGVPVLTDWWEGLEQFFDPGREILVARRTEDAVRAITMDRAELARIGRAARVRALEEHSSMRRADEMVALFESARRPEPGPPRRAAEGRGRSPASGWPRAPRP